MNYKGIFTILILLALIATVCICIKKPQMHNSVMVYDSQYTITPEKEIEVQQQEIPIMEQPAQPQVHKVEVEPQDFVQTQTIVVAQPKVTTQNKVATVQTQKTVQPKLQNTKVAQQSVQKQNNVVQTQTPQINLEKIVENNYKIQKSPAVETTPKNAPTVERTQTPTPQTVQKAAPSPVVQTKVQPQQPQKILTAQEEEIAWNVWRSNLNNKIMRDTNFPAVPAGTVFRYEFNVDKYGKITNVQTWSETSKYTPYAIQYMSPVIRSLQGRSILNFPQGTQRTSVKAGGAWKISTTSKYSTPNDYYDVEKITR